MATEPLYFDPVKWAWESLNRAPWPKDQITQWMGSVSPEGAQRIAVAKQAKVERNRKAVAAQRARRSDARGPARQVSEAERHRRRLRSAAAYQKLKAARAAATLATHPSARPAAAQSASAV
jgi:hypothetical protein